MSALPLILHRSRHQFFPNLAESAHSIPGEMGFRSPGAASTAGTNRHRPATSRATEAAHLSDTLPSRGRFGDSPRCQQFLSERSAPTLAVLTKVEVECLWPDPRLE